MSEMRVAAAAVSCGQRTTPAGTDDNSTALLFEKMGKITILPRSILFCPFLLSLSLPYSKRFTLPSALLGRQP